MTQLERIAEMEENGRRMQARLDELERRQRLMEERLGESGLSARQEVDVREIAQRWHLEQMAGRRPRRSAGRRK